MSYQDTENARLAATKYDACRYEFWREPIEDRNASIQAGHVMMRMRDMCRVYKVGSNGDCVDWIIEELDPERRTRINVSYTAWREGQEAPLDGTDLRTWSLVSEAERMNLAHFKIRTVEDLGNLPDNMLPNIGQGGRALRDKAKAWLTSATDNGKLAQQIAAMGVTLAEMKEAIAEKDAAIAALQAAQPEQPVRRGPGRPPKQLDAD